MTAFVVVFGTFGFALVAGYAVGWSRGWTRATEVLRESDKER
jgi:hypothetical protein